MCGVSKMPYYCTVPRCTSMAGKAKNVSFHQFPRDEELARLWNDILKRGKPYTKYSKVCSLHFKPEDYTITSVGKNKGKLACFIFLCRYLPNSYSGTITCGLITVLQNEGSSFCSSRVVGIMPPIIKVPQQMFVYNNLMLGTYVM